MTKEWKDRYGVNVLQTVRPQRCPLPAAFGQEAAEAVRAFHRQIPGYAPTPLVRLGGLAAELGVRAVFVKDESKRFGLNAFKGLGGSYAMFRVICGELGLDPARTSLRDLRTEEVRRRLAGVEFATATDGNHGRGVSFAGGLFGCRVHVRMPKGTVEARAEAIRRVGPAEVRITDVNYDETVRLIREESRTNGWHLIQDTAWDGYETVPEWIMQGYLTMAGEAMDALEESGTRPTHVFLQAGVGSMAGAVLAHIALRAKERPRFVIVEPTAADCFYRSALSPDGSARSVPGDPVTIMAGLNCGTPCKTIWPVLRDHAGFFAACPDYAAAHGMRLYARGAAGDERIVSGESGASTLGAAALILTRPELREAREAMGLSRDSVILLISTEGDTDPDGYRRVVQEGAFPLPEA